MIALDLGRLSRLLDLDERSRSRRSSRACAGRRSSTCCARAASRSATSRRASSTRPSAAGSRPARRARPRRATGASTSSSSGARLAAPAGEIALAGAPGERRGTGPARARRRVRGRPRRAHERHAEGATAPGGRPLRGLDAAVVRGRRRRRCATSSRRAWRPTSRGSPTSPRRRCRSRSPAWRGAKAAALGRYLSARGVAGGALAITGWEGDRERGRRAPARDDRGPAPPRRGDARRRAGARLGARALPRAVPARRPARAAACMVETLETATTWSGLPGLYGAVRSGAARARAVRRLSRLAPLRDRRLAVLHVPRAAGPGGPDRPVAAGQARRVRGDRRRGRDDHPPPRGRARPRAAISRPRTSALGVEALRAVKDAPGPRRDHEPGQAARPQAARYFVVLSLIGPVRYVVPGAVGLRPCLARDAGPSGIRPGPPAGVLCAPTWPFVVTAWK